MGNPKLPYKIYTAILNQTGNEPPVATILNNTIGTMVWGRNDEGQYVVVPPNDFVPAKTIVFMGNSAVDPNLTHISSNISEGFLSVQTSNMDGEGADDLLQNTAIEIRLYK